MNYSHQITIPHNLPPGPLWLAKHNEEELEQIRQSNSYVYDAQYKQQPSPKGGAIFKEEWWRYYTVKPIFEYKIITGDTAQSKGKHNDYTVFQAWGVYSKQLFLLDQYRDKVEAPWLRSAMVRFWSKHKEGCRKVYIEAASSGSSLIQTIKHEEKIPIFPIERSRDKISRAYDTSPYIESGYVHLPEEADFIFDYIEEHKKFTPLMNHKHDDQVDPTMDAIEICLMDKKQVGTFSDSFVGSTITNVPGLNSEVW